MNDTTNPTKKTSADRLATARDAYCRLHIALSSADGNTRADAPDDTLKILADMRDALKEVKRAKVHHQNVLVRRQLRLREKADAVQVQLAALAAPAAQAAE